MKAQLLVPLEKSWTTPQELAKYKAGAKQGIRWPLGEWPVGHVFETPDCFYLVMNGCAKPLDEECRVAAGNLTDEEIAERVAMYKKLDAGQLTGDPEVDAPDEEDDE